MITAQKLQRLKNKILSVTSLVATAALNTIAAEIENKIPDITNLATKATLNAKAAKVEK